MTHRIINVNRPNTRNRKKTRSHQSQSSPPSKPRSQHPAPHSNRRNPPRTYTYDLKAVVFWPSRDPIGDISTLWAQRQNNTAKQRVGFEVAQPIIPELLRDGPSLYGFVSNSPVTGIDILGLFQWYGNYGGPSWTNGGPDPGSQTPSGDVGPPNGPDPIDDQDDCYREHDICHKKCDEKFPERLICVKKRFRVAGGKHTVRRTVTTDGNAGDRKKCKRACDKALQDCLRKTRKDPSLDAGSLFHSYMADFGFNFTQR